VHKWEKEKHGKLLPDMVFVRNIFLKKNPTKQSQKLEARNEIHIKITIPEDISLNSSSTEVFFQHEE
jgi:hypothetical protein